MPKPVKFTFRIVAVIKGALGKPRGKTVYYTCPSLGEAMFMLWTDYDHIKIHSAFEGYHPISKDAIENTSPVDNGYKGKNNIS